MADFIKLDYRENMKKIDCYINDHRWIFVGNVENSDGSRYTLTRCLICGFECRSYENGCTERSYFNGLKAADSLQSLI